ncbi:MAG: hypothetical protein HQ483_19155 [Rhodospirillales bacterium]|nr:hypothetical protein [Rhodospirillales bacterium]
MDQRARPYPLDFNTLSVRPLSGSIGAEISGVDVTSLPDAQFAGRVKAGSIIPNPVTIAQLL